jgi:hypothetical protein
MTKVLKSEKLVVISDATIKKPKMDPLLPQRSTLKMNG